MDRVILIEYILNNSSQYKKEQLEHMSIQSLVIIKVGIELTINKIGVIFLFLITSLSQV